jgi:valyl-tRNA synthetase
MDKSYDFRQAEPAWAKCWDEQGIYRFDATSTKPVYSIDTPPPTVSGNLHIGHLFSYTHADALARYQRMRGREVFYPFGFDDNGLPTERFIEQTHRVQARAMDREDFLKLCLATVHAKEREFEKLWRRVGLSVDWSRCYSTISPPAQKISQRSLLELYHAGRIYKKEAPALWCPHCQTAIAQAELEDRESASFFIDVHFELDSGERVAIRTTRPELLPSCVALFAHPKDQRYTRLAGHTARTPLFDEEVPIRFDEQVDREKGTGLVMCCTFGDTTDIAWWNEHNLPSKTAIDREGRMTAIAGPYRGLAAREARVRISDELEAQGLGSHRSEIFHSVNVHERCGTEIELLITPQWFIRLLDMKEALLKAGEEIEWQPPFMKKRYIHWVENLKWDWCISRQRVFGVPLPLWRCARCDEVVSAPADQLPVDPTRTSPGSCPKCGKTELEPERDMLDTWATSSLTPQINGRWGEPDEWRDLIPMDLRPQAHEIIRTWAFYTIAKSLLHTKKIPWKRILISGWVLAEQGGKISKSKGGGPRDPRDLLENQSADALRYWACRSRPGMDTTYSDEVVAQGKRLVTKLWNATKFALTHLKDYDGAPPELELIDRWLLSKLSHTIEQATASFESCDYSSALAVTEKFFWRDLCDNYLEIVKKRLYHPKTYQMSSRRAAQHVLHQSLTSTLKLLAPIMPFITEELFQRGFATVEAKGLRSIHVLDWPTAPASWRDGEADTAGNLAIAVIEAVRKEKSLRKLSMAAPVRELRVGAKPELHGKLAPLLSAIGDVTNAQQIQLCEDLPWRGVPAGEGMDVWLSF